MAFAGCSRMFKTGVQRTGPVFKRVTYLSGSMEKKFGRRAECY
jgi:hypothetical protein